jgi:hypothetical protein
MPAADFCCTVRRDCSILSPDSGTCSRPPEVSSTAFNAQPPDLQPAPLMDMDFAIIGPLVRHRMPRIWFLFIGSHLCSTLLSDHASQRRPCASLSLLLHQDGKRTFTSKLSNMLGTPKQSPRRSGGLHTNRTLLTSLPPRLPWRLRPCLHRSWHICGGSAPRGRRCPPASACR